jgi:ribosomal-protein-alanine N-acetyltransferase
MSSGAPAIRPLDETLAEPLARFFQELVKAGDETFFHPHPLTDDEAAKRAKYQGKDLYYVLTDGDEIIGYGMLRGWDEGYDIPSLGLVIHPAERGKNLGELLLLFLHAAAGRLGANKIRLKVDADNKQAIALYKKCGYSFTDEHSPELVGHVELQV